MYEAKANCVAQYPLYSAPVVEVWDLNDKLNVFLFTKKFGVSHSDARIILRNKRPMVYMDIDMRQGIRELFRLDEGGAHNMLSATFGRLISTWL